MTSTEAGTDTAVPGVDPAQERETGDCYANKSKERRLTEYKERLPPRLARFLDNFFGTCSPYEPWENYRNYRVDLDLYARTSRVYREHRRDLLEAFHEITGWRLEPPWPGGN